MPKIKTNKKISKRFKISKSGAVVHEKCGQDHFNAKEPGKVKRQKRKRNVLSKKGGLSRLAKTLIQ